MTYFTFQLMSKFTKYGKGYEEGFLLLFFFLWIQDVCNQLRFDYDLQLLTLGTKR